VIKVYVAGPYSADNVIDVLKNIGRGKKMCADLFSMGFAPFCPWHDSNYVTDRFNDIFTVEQFYEYSMCWLEVSDCVFLVDGWESSRGTLKEIERAEELNIPVFSSTIELLDFRNSKFNAVRSQKKTD